MKKNILQRSGLTALAVLLIAFAMTSCHKEDVVSESTFTITPKVIRAHSATFEVVPITNEFYYEADAMPLDMYNRLGEQGVVDLTNQYYDSLKAVLDANHINYDNDYLYYRGLYDCASTEYLPASTPCVFYVMRLSNITLEPILPIITYPFITTPEIKREMTFDISMEDNRLYVEPSDTFPYLWDYIPKDELIESYSGDPEYFLHSILSMYEEYGFIESLISQGYDSENVLDWFPNLQSGDSLYVVAVGYEQGELTTDITTKAFAIQ